MPGDSTLNYLYDLAEGDMGFVNEILDLMAKNIPIDLIAIEKAITDNDIQQLQRSAHHMKSSIQYSNNESLSELLSILEKKTAIADAKALLPQVNELAAMLMRLIETEKKRTQ